MREKAHLVRTFIESTCQGEPWLERAWETTQAPDSVAFRAAFASVKRRLGARAHEHVSGPEELRAEARPHFTLTDWVRLALTLNGLASTSEEQHARTVLQLFEAGEIGEQESVLRTLSLLPQAERFIETGLQACRTNAQRVFEAIACENAYPATYFPELNFNQLVLKAIFMEVSVKRIENLRARVTPELKRMAEDYASERRAAGRIVPEDTDYIVRGGL